MDASTARQCDGALPALVWGDTAILAENDSNDSKITVQIPKERQPMAVNDSVERQRRPGLTCTVSLALEPQRDEPHDE